MTEIALTASNSLTDLAARIRTEHRAASDKMSEALLHAMTAGELLIEAKDQLKHGQWLPWLRDHCSISTRTAQLYMRVGASRAEIEAAKAQSVAHLDLTLNEAAALLMLSSNARKLMAFMKECEGLEGEELVQACLDAGVGVVVSKNYDMFAGQSDEQRREWKLFALWLTKQGRRNAAHHVEWLMRTGDGGVADGWGRMATDTAPDWVGSRSLSRARPSGRPFPRLTPCTVKWRSTRRSQPQPRPCRTARRSVAAAEKGRADDCRRTERRMDRRRPG